MRIIIEKVAERENVISKLGRKARLTVYRVLRATGTGVKKLELFSWLLRQNCHFNSDHMSFRSKKHLYFSEYRKGR